MNPSIVLQLLTQSDIIFADRRLRRRCNYFGNILAFRRQQLLKSWNFGLYHAFAFRQSRFILMAWKEFSMRTIFAKHEACWDNRQSSRIEALNPVAHDQQAAQSLGFCSCSKAYLHRWQSELVYCLWQWIGSSRHTCRDIKLVSGPTWLIRSRMV